VRYHRRNRDRFYIVVLESSSSAPRAPFDSKLRQRAPCEKPHLDAPPDVLDHIELKFFIIRLFSLLSSLSLISSRLSLTFFPRQSPISNLTLFCSFQYAFNGTTVIPGILSVFCSNRLASCLFRSRSLGRRSSCWKNSPAVECLPI
jgi:hypothetical protein